MNSDPITPPPPAASIPDLVEEDEEEDSDEEDEEDIEGYVEPTIADLLKEAAQEELDAADPEATISALRTYPITTFNIQRLGCTSHKVSSPYI